MSVFGIGQRFSRVAVKYTEEARVQAQLRQDILARAVRCRSLSSAPRRILDIGCGTGYLAAELAAQWPQAIIDAVDIAGEMIDVARSRHNAAHNIRWHVADFRAIELEPGYDLIVSNAALHWMPPLSTAMSRIAGLLEKNAAAIFSIIVEGSLKELHQARKVVAPGRPAVAVLPTIDDCFMAVDQAGFLPRVAEVRKTRLQFASAKQVFKHLQNSGVNGNIFAEGAGVVERQITLSESRLSIREVRALEVEYNSEYAGESLPLSYHSLLVELELLNQSFPRR